MSAENLKPRPSASRSALTGYLGRFGLMGGDAEGFAASSEDAAMVGRLQSKTWRQHVEQSLVVREQRSVRHGYADAELDVKAMAKIDITEVTALNGQSVGFGDLLACS